MRVGFPLIAEACFLPVLPRLSPIHFMTSRPTTPVRDGGPAILPAWHSARAVAFLCLAVLLAFAPTVEAKKHKLSRDEAELFRLIQNDRIQTRREMTLDPILCLVARKRAREMARKNEFAHIDAKGNGPNRRVTKAGYRLPATYETSKTANNIESILRTTGSNRFAMKVWKSSEGHKVHVFGLYDFYRAQKCIGIGSAMSKSGERFCVFLSAHPNVSRKPPKVILLDPNGKVLAKTRKRSRLLPSL